MIRENITFTFNDEAQREAFKKMLVVGPDGWREQDETQRAEIARLRADAEISVKRIAELEALLREIDAKVVFEAAVADGTGNDLQRRVEAALVIRTER